MDDHDSDFEVLNYNLTPDSFDETLHQPISNSFSLTHVNIRSLGKNFDELSFLYDHTLKSKFDIICLSEVWNVRNTAMLGMSGYTLEVKCRKDNARGGGVGAYIRSSLKYNILDFELLHAESLWLEISVNKKRVTPKTCWTHS